MYQSKKYFDEGLNFDDVFPEKQEALRGQNFAFDFQEVADFVRINSQDFSLSQPELEAVDKQIKMVVDLWRGQSQPAPVPAPAPAPMPEPELQEDEEITAEEIREEIMALTEALEVIDDPEDRALLESEIDALNQALEFIE
jgi:hypothetical protein